jgi:hypothetical protein
MLTAHVRRLTARSVGAEDDPKGDPPPHY